MEEIKQTDNYCILQGTVIYKTYFVVIIKRMLTVSDFLEIANVIYKSNKKAKVKFRFATSKPAELPKKRTYKTIKNNLPLQTQLSF